MTLRNPRAPRVLILGTGAMACVLGARLARFGRATVTLAGTWRAGLAAMAEHGITIEEPNAVWSVKVGVSPLAGPLGPADIVLALVKSHRTAAIAATAARVLLPGSFVVTIQNGLGNREVLEAAAGSGRVGSGVATLASRLLGPGQAREVPGRIVLGTEPVLVHPLADLLRASRVDTDLSEDIARLAWRKLAADCGVQSLSALLGKPNGSLLESPDPRETLIRAAREVGAVAAARGIALGGDAAAFALETAEHTASQRSTMLEDLERGAPTEIDALCGAVVREASAHGVPAPVNEYLWRRVREKEGRPLPLPAAV